MSSISHLSNTPAYSQQCSFSPRPVEVILCSRPPREGRQGPTGRSYRLWYGTLELRGDSMIKKGVDEGNEKVIQFTNFKIEDLE